MCTPGMGANLWGESPLYVNPVNVLNMLTKILAEGKGIAARHCPKEAGLQTYEPTNPAMAGHIRPSLRASQHDMTKPWIREIG
jgi:hypothetical protein